VADRRISPRKGFLKAKVFPRGGGVASFSHPPNKWGIEVRIVPSHSKFFSVPITPQQNPCQHHVWSGGSIPWAAVITPSCACTRQHQGPKLSRTQVCSYLVPPSLPGGGVNTPLGSLSSVFPVKAPLGSRREGHGKLSGVRARPKLSGDNLLGGGGS